MFTHQFQSFALVALLCVGAAWLPATLQAQQNTAADRGSSAAQALIFAKVTPVATLGVPAAGPLRAPARITRTLQARPLDLGQPQGDGRAHVGSNVAMMGTGAAAVVVGLLIGGDGGTIISLSGGVIGLVGLYRFLR